MIIKKIGVIITSLIFITTLSLVPVKADEIVSTEIDTYSPTLTEEEQKQIIGAKYLVEYLRQGGSIDLTNKSNGYTAVDLIDDIADFVNGTLAQFLGDEGYWINNISDTQVPTYIALKEPNITNDINMMFGLLPFLATSEEPTPTPVIPENYLQYINKIQTWTDGNISAYTAPIYNSTEFIWDNRTDYSYTPLYPNQFSGRYSPVYSYEYVTVYINEVNGEFITTTSNLNQVQAFKRNGQLKNTQNFIFDNQWLFYYNMDNQSWITTFTHTDITLGNALSYVSNYWKNIDLYVNGEPWIANHTQNYHIDLGQGTYIDNTNQPIQYDYPEPTKIDLTDLIDRLDLLIANQNKIKFPDFSDLIVDENGQQAVAVVVVNKDLSIDDWYVTNYGTLIPLFPVYVTFPVEMSDITTIATVGIKDVIPTDILEVFGIALIGMLFVTWIHRLLE